MESRIAEAANAVAHFEDFEKVLEESLENDGARMIILPAATAADTPDGRRLKELEDCNWLEGARVKEVS